jgi:hypothetical protein
MAKRLMYRHFAFKANSSLTEEVLASEEEPLHLFGLLGYRPNLRIFIIVYKLFDFLLACGTTRAMASSFTRFLEHTQRRATVGRTPLDLCSACRRDLYLTTLNAHKRHISAPRWDSNQQSQQARGRRPTP